MIIRRWSMSNSKPSRNAFYGYTYQENITFFLLAKMDVEREIESIEMEVTEDHNFDDAKIIIRGIEYSFQMKDLEKISFKDLIITVETISIQRREHKLSKGLNILFFKDIDVINNSEIFGLPAFQKENLFIISASREFISDEIDKIYFQNENRISVIDKFFKNRLDNRNTKLKISLADLPPIQFYNNQLLEETINVRRKILEFDKILHIEGKPGVGKSHLAKSLTEESTDNILYRFWTSSQDKDKKERLIFDKFLFAFSKKVFGDQKRHSEDEIIEKLTNKGRVVILDGLDHVETYANEELNSYISFIQKLKEKCKVYVLSRPLETKLNWEKQILENWNWEQTIEFLDGAYPSMDYSIRLEIFRITSGYPILVRYIAEHYKIYKIIPDLNELENLDEFYKSVPRKENFKIHLNLFISSSSFFMESELDLFLNDSADYVKEYMSTYPYLFDIRLNRISLFHDSFNTYLKKQGIDNSKRMERVNEIVFQSIMNGEKRFLYRFSNFSLNKEMKLKIIRKYSSMDEFERIMKDTIDIEAIRSFYNQVREAIQEINPEDLAIHNYYDLALIINIIQRDHVSTNNKFLYTFVKCLLFNGYTEEDFTSSEYLFGMLYFVRTGNSVRLNDLSNNEGYITEYFYENLKSEIKSEERYFDFHKKPVKLKIKIQDLFNSNYNTLEEFPKILANLYIHHTDNDDLLEIQKSIHEYMNGNIESASNLLKIKLSSIKYNPSNHSITLYLIEAKSIIESLGFGDEPNKYRKTNLKDFIFNFKSIGSFSLRDEILNYLRLSLEEKRKIDLESISSFCTMYGERKDYSVTNIDVALTAFEDKKLIAEEESIEIIKFTQSISDKGIRDLFNNYIDLHSPEIRNDVTLKFGDSSIQRYNQGVLSSGDLEFIKDRNLLATEIAGFADVTLYRSVFSDLQMYSIYPKEYLRKDIQTILYNAMIGNIGRINLFGALFYFVGNLPRFLIDLQMDEDFERHYRSFRKFLEISLLVEGKKSLA